MTGNEPVVPVTGAADAWCRIVQRLHREGWRLRSLSRIAAEAAALAVIKMNAIRPNSALTVAAELRGSGNTGAACCPRGRTFRSADALVNNASTYHATPIR